MNDLDGDTLVFATVEQIAGTLFPPPPPPILPIEFGAASHVGNVRSRNEDHFAVVRFRRDCEIMLASLVHCSPSVCFSQPSR